MKSFEILSAKQSRAIRALLLKKTMRDAAAAAGVTEITLWRWVQQPEFVKALTDASARALETAIASLQSACNDAVIVLRHVMTDLGAPASARVSAARTVLETAVRARELIQHEQRLSEL